jgi:hypothetical protein
MIVLLVTPAAVELSVWMGLLGWGHPMLMRVWRWGIILHAVMKSTASLDSDSDDITNLMIWAMERTAMQHQIAGRDHPLGGRYEPQRGCMNWIC